MRRFTNILASIVLCLSVIPSLAQKKVAIILQENGGATVLDEYLPPASVSRAQAVIDALAEGFMSLKSNLQVAGRYDKVVDLSDRLCTRRNLLAHLTDESALGNVVDLYIYGHGGVDRLSLFGGERLTGEGIRNLLTDARRQRGLNFTFNLRLVYMCNCHGSTCDDYWVGIGARASVGSRFLNCMPEPQITFFINDFVVNNVPVSRAAQNAWSLSRPFWTAVPTWQDRDPEHGNLNKIDQSEPVVSGPERNLRHTDIRLSVGEEREFTVSAKKAYNFPDLFVVAGERYTFSASGSWVNCNGCLTGSTSAGPGGYTPSPVDGGRRRTEYNMMALVGEMFSRNDDMTSYMSGQHFLVGRSATFTPTINGFLCLFANDGLAFYGDNSGSVTVTVRRTR